MEDIDKKSQLRWKPSGDTWKGPTCSGLSFCAVLYASTGWVVARLRCVHEDPEHQGPHSGQAFSRQPLPLLADAPPSSSIFATMGSFTAPSASCCGSSYMFVVLPHFRNCHPLEASHQSAIVSHTVS